MKVRDTFLCPCVIMKRSAVGWKFGSLKNLNGFTRPTELGRAQLFDGCVERLIRCLVNTCTGIFQIVPFSMCFGPSSTCKRSFSSLKIDFLEKSFQGENVLKPPSAASTCRQGKPATSPISDFLPFLLLGLHANRT